MSWFDTKGLASLAKTALKEAQKQIDKALDIQEEELARSATMAADAASTGAQPTVATARKLPGGANREKSKTEPNTPLADSAAVAPLAPAAAADDGRIATSTANWGSFTGSFFDNPNANEMVTIPPKATATPKVGAAPTAAAAAAGGKRESVTSNSDSVELLSPPTVSPTSPPETAVNNSESVDVITSPDSGPSLPESIVIISSSEADEAGEEDEDDTMSFNTVLDDTLTHVTGAEGLREPNESKRFHYVSLAEATGLFVDADATPRGSAAALDHSHSSTGTAKLLISMEETPMDSDSTQSFEDVQMTASACKESTHSPTTSDEKLELMKLAATATPQSYSSPHNSNDEMETTTSSDIEIISNPNGDSSSTNSATQRTSPLKAKKAPSYQCSQSAAATPTAAPSKKGHFREPSEISILSEDSQTELDKLTHRISELSELLEARELRLLQSERQNAALQERNSELQAALEAATSNSSIFSSTEEYTQRLSALEKKFQASIRERDSLSVQINTLREELQRKIPKDDLAQVVAESNAVIAELRLEGEKLSKEILQQSNIIKKLRVKEKTSDVMLKKNKEQIASLTDETERLKKTLNAKEEVERAQIEAVHKMSSEKRKLDEENAQQRSKIEDLQSKLMTLQSSFDAVKTELQQRSRLHSDLTRTAEEAVAAKKERELTKAENQEILLQLNELREKLRGSEHAMTKREQQLREENRQLITRLEAAELRAESSTQEVSLTTIPLMRQLESLQNTLSQRTRSWNKEEKTLLDKLDISQTRLKALESLEANFKEKSDLLQARCLELEGKLSNTLMQEDKLKMTLHQAQLDYSLSEANLKRQILELSDELNECKSRLLSLEELHKNLKDSVQSKAETKVSISSSADEFQHRELTAATLKEAERMASDSQQQQQRAQSPAASFGMNSLEEAMGVSIDWHADDIDCISNSGRHASALTSGMYFHLMGHNTTTLEHLQSLLKQRDGELNQLQWELSRLQAERGVLNEEISNITLELENLKDKLQSYETLEKNFDELQHRYDALLQMYGEKSERTQELELDLVELKEAYKVQIDELLAQPPT